MNRFCYIDGATQQWVHGPSVDHFNIYSKDDVGNMAGTCGNPANIILNLLGSETWNDIRAARPRKEPTPFIKGRSLFVSKIVSEIADWKAGSSVAIYKRDINNDTIKIYYRSEDSHVNGRYVKDLDVRQEWTLIRLSRN